MATKESEEAQRLTQFLLTKSGYGGTQASPIEAMVQAKISEMAREIAAEIVSENPELPDVIRAKARAAVAQALRDDAWLNRAVVDSIAKVITETALGN